MKSSEVCTKTRLPQPHFQSKARLLQLLNSSDRSFEHKNFRCFFGTFRTPSNYSREEVTKCNNKIVTLSNNSQFHSLCLVAWPLSRSKAAVDFVFIQTQRFSLVNKNYNHGEKLSRNFLPIYNFHRCSEFSCQFPIVEGRAFSRQVYMLTQVLYGC